VIGRSPSADVVLADTSVAPHHAELVITADGRLHLTDCATDGGTSVKAESGSSSGWRPVRQDFVRPDQLLRLGDYECTAGDLLRWSRAAPADASAAAGGAWQRRVRGAVARDPTTGEIVRRRP
jgi:FHA domain